MGQNSILCLSSAFYAIFCILSINPALWGGKYSQLGNVTIDTWHWSLNDLARTFLFLWARVSHIPLLLPPFDFLLFPVRKMTCYQFWYLKSRWNLLFGWLSIKNERNQRQLSCNCLELPTFAPLFRWWKEQFIFLDYHRKNV